MSEAHQREAALFDAAMDLPPGQRAAYLDQACGGDAALRQRMESLLKASESHCEFLDPSTDPALRPTSQITVPLTEKPSDRIGRYKLLQRIGEGGCGVVYMAEQEEPVCRRVALKIIKLGMDTKSVIARFEAERQVLALMDHPGIAKVFDAGATETGRPYFVMELVRGIKITDFCDEKQLSTHARLDLFIQVCQAIQHAHQKGIIHRDIKPSNVLVSVNDGVMVPKIIDFGIAKATTGQKLTDKTLFTAFEQLIGTPAYMSPEQAVVTNVDIDTRSDIYALGVLLYELLTGKTPFDPKELLEIGLDEMRRTIRETEPPRPSTRVSTLAGQELSTTAQRRGLEAPKLVSELRGDLDWIVMKCLEKDRAHRYETANGLAMDIQRHLDNEPVVAGPPSAVYRFRKLVLRNQLAFTAAGAIAAALLIGLSVSTWMFFKEKAARQRAVAAERDQMRLRQQADIARRNEATLRLQAQAGEKKAETEAAKSRMVAQFLKDMLQSIRPSVALGRDTTLIREMMDQTAERVGQDLADQPEVRADLQTTIAEVYRAIGKDEKAEIIQRRALAVRQASGGRGDPEVAQALNHLALILWPEGEGSGLERWRDERRVMGAEILNDFEPAQLGRDGQSESGRMAEIERLHRQALAIRRETSGNENLETTESLNNLALVLRREGKLDEAEALHREALASRRKILTGDRLPTAESLHNLAVVLRDGGKLAEAEGHFRESLEMRRRLLGTADPSVARTVHHLVDVLEGRNDFAGIQSLFRQELTNAISRSPNKPLLESDPVYQILDVLLAKKQYGQVDQWVSDLLAPAIQKAPENVGLLRTRGEFFSRRGRWSEAAADLARVIELDPETHDPWYHLAPLLLRSGATNEYRRLCHEMLLRFGGANPPLVAERTAKACLLLPSDSGDLALAAELAQTAVVAGLDHPFVHYYQFALGLAEYRQGHYSRAQDWLRHSLAGNDNENLALPARLVLAMTCHQLGKTNEARYALDEAIALAEPSFLSRAPDADDFTPNWFDVLIFQILRKEANALFGRDRTADRQPFLAFNEAVRLAKEGQGPEAEAVLRETVTRYKAIFGPEHALLIGPLHLLGRVLERQQKLSEAEAAYRECMALREKGGGKRGLLRVQVDLFFLLNRQEKWKECESVASRSMEVTRSLFGDEHPEMAAGLFLLAASQTNPVEAESLYRQALAIFEKTDSDELPSYSRLFGRSSHQLGVLLAKQGKWDEAESFHRRAVTLFRKASRPNSDLSTALCDLANLLGRRNALAEARPLAEEAASLLREHPEWDAVPTHHVAQTFIMLAGVLTDLGDVAALEEFTRESLPYLRERLPPDDPQFAGVLAQLARGLLKGSDCTTAATAEPLVRECLAIRQQKAPEDWRTFNARSMLGGCLLGQRQYADAELLLIAGYEGMRARIGQIPVPSLVHVTDTLERLVQLYQNTDRPEQADTWKQKLAAWKLKRSELESADSLHEQARVLGRRGQWQEAAANLLQVREVTPEDEWVWHELAPLLVVTGQRDGYREQCRKIVERFGKTSDPLVAGRIAKDCLMFTRNCAGLPRRRWLWKRPAKPFRPPRWFMKRGCGSPAIKGGAGMTGPISSPRRPKPCA